jgi:acetaldehyde dehydrogenase (acetylating)
MGKQDAKYDSQSEKFLQSKKMDLDAGALGKFFGSPSNARMNIAGITVCLLTLSGIIIIFLPAGYCKIAPADYWNIIAPIITLILGYIFGKSN